VRRPVRAFVVVFAACPIVFAAVANGQGRPEIYPPVLAIENTTDNPSFVPVAITGRNFGSEIGTSKVNFIATNADVESYSATNSDVVLWQDDKIIVKVAAPFDHRQVEVELDGGLKSLPVTADRYLYDYVSTELDESLDSKPLAIAAHGDFIYLLEEFSSKFKKVSTTNSDVTDASVLAYEETVKGVGNCFADPKFFDPNGTPDDTVNWSGLNESVIVDENGLVWFGQAGTNFFNGIARNHSRILSFDPEATSGNPYRVYNVPGDNNQVSGLAWDAHRKRIWFANSPRYVGGICRSILLPARLMSFRPVDGDSGTTDIDSSVYSTSFRFDTAAAARTCEDGAIGWVAATNTDAAYTTGTPGTCDNATSRPCYTADDCVLVDKICTGDSCFREYPLALDSVLEGYCYNHSGAGTISHLVVSSWDHAVWFGNFLGGDYVDPAVKAEGATMFLGRFDPDTSPSPTEIHYPIRFIPFGEAPNGPWELEEAANGDIVFTLDSDNSVGRFPIGRALDSACLSLTSPTTDCETDPDETCRNPCIEIDTPVGFEAQNMHSLVEDKAGNFWVSQYLFESDPALASTIGFWKADRSGFAMFPSPSLFSDSSDSCTSSSFGKFTGAGLALDRTNGDIWFADYCRERLGRLRKSDCE
jgi:hypothetical protein